MPYEELSAYGYALDYFRLSLVKTNYSVKRSALENAYIRHPLFILRQTST
jgi:hypothetical protein